MKKIYMFLLLMSAMFFVSCNQDAFIKSVKVPVSGGTTEGTSGGTGGTTGGSDTNYTIDGNGVITAFTDTDISRDSEGKYDISIPSTIVGVTVKKLGDSLFAEPWRIKGLTLPNTLEEIGSDVFSAYGLSVKTLVLPNSLKTIGANAFKGAAINNLTIPNTVTAIGTDAFKDVDAWGAGTLTVTIVEQTGGNTATLKSLLEASTNKTVVYN